MNADKLSGANDNMELELIIGGANNDMYMKLITGRINNDTDIELTIIRANNDTDVEIDIVGSSRVINNIDMELNGSELGRAAKIIKKVIKVCEFNLFSLLLTSSRS